MAAVKKTARKKTSAKAKTSPKTKQKRRSASNQAKKRTNGQAGKSVQPKRSSGSEKRTEYLKKILLKKRNEVVQGLEAQMGRKLSLDPGQKIDSAMDSADMSSQDMDQGIDYSLLEMKYAQYKDIADALRKFQNGTYGLCEECGQEIDVKRLEVNPFARYCIACKTRREDLEKIQKEETRFKE